MNTLSHYLKTAPLLAIALSVSAAVPAHAADPGSTVVYVSSGDGIEIFDPVAREFTHFSDVRVDDLAFSPEGDLWVTRWPGRGDVIRFDQHGHARGLAKRTQRAGQRLGVDIEARRSMRSPWRSIPSPWCRLRGAKAQHTGQQPFPC